MPRPLLKSFSAIFNRFENPTSTADVTEYDIAGLKAFFENASSYQEAFTMFQANLVNDPTAQNDNLFRAIRDFITSQISEWKEADRCLTQWPKPEKKKKARDPLLAELDDEPSEEQEQQSIQQFPQQPVGESQQSQEDFESDDDEDEELNGKGKEHKALAISKLLSGLLIKFDKATSEDFFGGSKKATLSTSVRKAAGIGDISRVSIDATSRTSVDTSRTSIDIPSVSANKKSQTETPEKRLINDVMMMLPPLYARKFQDELSIDSPEYKLIMELLTACMFFEQPTAKEYQLLMTVLVGAYPQGKICSEDEDIILDLLTLRAKTLSEREFPEFVSFLDGFKKTCNTLRCTRVAAEIEKIMGSDSTTTTTTTIATVEQAKRQKQALEKLKNKPLKFLLNRQFFKDMSYREEEFKDYQAFITLLADLLKKHPYRNGPSKKNQRILMCLLEEGIQRFTQEKSSDDGLAISKNVENFLTFLIKIHQQKSLIATNIFEEAIQKLLLTQVDVLRKYSQTYEVNKWLIKKLADIYRRYNQVDSNSKNQREFRNKLLAKAAEKLVFLSLNSHDNAALRQEPYELVKEYELILNSSPADLAEGLLPFYNAFLLQIVHQYQKQFEVANKPENREKLEDNEYFVKYFFKFVNDIYGIYEKWPSHPALKDSIHPSAQELISTIADWLKSIENAGAYKKTMGMILKEFPDICMLLKLADDERRDELQAALRKLFAKVIAKANIDKALTFLIKSVDRNNKDFILEQMLLLADGYPLEVMRHLVQYDQTKFDDQVNDVINTVREKELEKASPFVQVLAKLPRSPLQLTATAEWIVMTKSVEELLASQEHKDDIVAALLQLLKKRKEKKSRVLDALAAKDTDPFEANLIWLLMTLSRDPETKGYQLVLKSAEEITKAAPQGNEFFLLVNEDGSLSYRVIDPQGNDNYKVGSEGNDKKLQTISAKDLKEKLHAQYNKLKDIRKHLTLLREMLVKIDPDGAIRNQQANNSSVVYTELTEDKLDAAESALSFYLDIKEGDDIAKELHLERLLERFKQEELANVHYGNLEKALEKRIIERLNQLFPEILKITSERGDTYPKSSAYQNFSVIIKKANFIPELTQNFNDGYGLLFSLSRLTNHYKIKAVEEELLTAVVVSATTKIRFVKQFFELYTLCFEWLDSLIGHDDDKKLSHIVLQAFCASDLFKSIGVDVMRSRFSTPGNAMMASYVVNEKLRSINAQQPKATHEEFKKFIIDAYDILNTQKIAISEVLLESYFSACETPKDREIFLQFLFEKLPLREYVERDNSTFDYFHKVAEKFVSVDEFSDVTKYLVKKVNEFEAQLKPAGERSKEELKGFITEVRRNILRGLSIVEGKFSDNHVNCLSQLTLINTEINPFIIQKVSMESLEAEKFASEQVNQAYSRISQKCLEHLRVAFANMAISGELLTNAKLVGGDLPQEVAALELKLTEQKRIFVERLTQSEPMGYKELSNFSAVLVGLTKEMASFTEKVNASLKTLEEECKKGAVALANDVKTHKTSLDSEMAELVLLYNKLQNGKRAPYEALRDFKNPISNEELDNSLGNYFSRIDAVFTAMDHFIDGSKGKLAEDKSLFSEMMREKLFDFPKKNVAPSVTSTATTVIETTPATSTATTTSVVAVQPILLSNVSIESKIQKQLEDQLAGQSLTQQKESLEKLRTEFKVLQETSHQSVSQMTDEVRSAGDFLTIKNQEMLDRLGEEIGKITPEVESAKNSVADVEKVKAAAEEAIKACKSQIENTQQKICQLEAEEKEQNFVSQMYKGSEKILTKAIPALQKEIEERYNATDHSAFKEAADGISNLFTDSIQVRKKKIEKNVWGQVGCDVFPMRSFPDNNHLEPYKNHYILVGHELKYVTPRGEYENVELTDSWMLVQGVEKIRKVGEDKVHLSYKQARNLITLNGGHSHVSGGYLMPKIWFAMQINIAWKWLRGLMPPALKNWAKNYWQKVAVDLPEEVEKLKEAQKMITALSTLQGELTADKNRAYFMGYEPVFLSNDQDLTNATPTENQLLIAPGESKSITYALISPRSGRVQRGWYIPKEELQEELGEKYREFDDILTRIGSKTSTEKDRETLQTQFLCDILKMTGRKSRPTVPWVTGNTNAIELLKDDSRLFPVVRYSVNAKVDSFISLYNEIKQKLVQYTGYKKLREAHAQALSASEQIAASKFAERLSEDTALSKFEGQLKKLHNNLAQVNIQLTQSNAQLNRVTMHYNTLNTPYLALFNYVNQSASSPLVTILYSTTLSEAEKERQLSTMVQQRSQKRLSTDIYRSTLAQGISANPLYHAVNRGTPQMVRIILKGLESDFSSEEQATLLNSKADEEGMTPLHRAIFLGDFEKVKLLAEALEKASGDFNLSAVVSGAPRTEMSPLLLACYLGKIEIFDYLLSLRSQVYINVNAVDNFNNNLMSFAVTRGDKDTIVWLLRSDSGFSKTHEANNNGETSLVVAAKRAPREDRYEIIRMLVQSGTAGSEGFQDQANNYLNILDKQGNNFLQRAILDGDLSLVRWLTRRGNVALLNAENHLHETPIQMAARLAATTQEFNILDELLSIDAVDINKENSSGNTLLSIALVSQQSEEVIQRIFAHRALNVEQQSLPLLKACINNNRYLAALVSKGINLKAVDDKNLDNTALHFAAKAGDFSTVQALVNYGVDIAPQNKDKMTPFMLAYANFHGRLEKNPLINYFIEKKAGINLADAKGNTILHYAAANGDARVVKLLGDKAKVSIHPQNGKGMTPLMLLYMNKNLDSQQKEDLIDYFIKKTTRTVLTGSAEDLFDQCNAEGNNIVHLAVASDDLPSVKKFVAEKGALDTPLDKENNDGYKVFHLVKSVKMARYFINFIANEADGKKLVKHLLGLNGAIPNNVKKEIVKMVASKLKCSHLTLAGDLFSEEHAVTPEKPVLRHDFQTLAKPEKEDLLIEAIAQKNAAAVALYLDEGVAKDPVQAKKLELSIDFTIEKSKDFWVKVVSAMENKAMFCLKNTAGDTFLHALLKQKNDNNFEHIKSLADNGLIYTPEKDKSGQSIFSLVQGDMITERNNSRRIPENQKAPSSRSRPKRGVFHEPSESPVAGMQTRQAETYVCVLKTIKNYLFEGLQRLKKCEDASPTTKLTFLTKKFKGAQSIESELIKGQIMKMISELDFDEIADCQMMLDLFQEIDTFKKVQRADLASEMLWESKDKHGRCIAESVFKRHDHLLNDFLRFSKVQNRAYVSSDAQLVRSCEDCIRMKLEDFKKGFGDPNFNIQNIMEAILSFAKSTKNDSIDVQKYTLLVANDNGLLINEFHHTNGDLANIRARNMLVHIGYMIEAFGLANLTELPNGGINGSVLEYVRLKGDRALYMDVVKTFLKEFSLSNPVKIVMDTLSARVQQQPLPTTTAVLSPPGLNSANSSSATSTPTSTSFRL